MLIVVAELKWTRSPWDQWAFPVFAIVVSLLRAPRSITVGLSALPASSYKGNTVSFGVRHDDIRGPPSSLVNWDSYLPRPGRAETSDATSMLLL